MNLVVAYKQRDSIHVCLLESYNVFEITQSFAWRDIFMCIRIQIISKENDRQSRVFFYCLLPKRPSVYVRNNKYLCRYT